MRYLLILSVALVLCAARQPPIELAAPPAPVSMPAAANAVVEAGAKGAGQQQSIEVVADPDQAKAFPFWTTVLWTALGAVVASVITASFTRATKISEFRQIWINGLRDDIAEFTGLVAVCNSEAGSANSSFTGEQKERRLKETYQPALVKARVLLMRIHLRINPLHNRHANADREFLTAIDALWDTAKDPLACPNPALDEMLSNAERHSRLLLKREWEATKSRLFT